MDSTPVNSMVRSLPGVPISPLLLDPAQAEAGNQVTDLALTADAGQGGQFRIGGEGAGLPAAADAGQGMRC